jgi:glycosyltransferase involved in cell wall biosynthesis
MLSEGAHRAFSAGVAGESEDGRPSASSLADRKTWGTSPADVLAINRVGFFGGVERVILTAAASAATQGWRTVLACPPGDLARRAWVHQVPVRHVDVCSLTRADIGRSPAAWVRVAGEVQRGSQEILQAVLATGARIIHAHHPVTVLQARSAAKFRGAPLIWHVHETAPIPMHYRALAAMVAQACDLFLCVSEASRAMVRELGAPAGRTRLVYNAVEPRFFRRAPNSGAALAEGPNVGLFGVLEPRKGHADLIRACAMLAGRWPTLHLWIVGGPGSAGHDEYRSQLKQLAQEVGIGDRVHFTGPRDDIPELMAAMDAVVSASIASESLPTVLLEACAMGVPALATNVGGASEIIRHGETGLLAPPGAPTALAANLTMLLSPAGRTMAQRARRDAERRFSTERFAAEISECYRQLAERAAESRP